MAVYYVNQQINRSNFIVN